MEPILFIFLSHHPQSIISVLRPRRPFWSHASVSRSPWPPTHRTMLTFPLLFSSQLPSSSFAPPPFCPSVSSYFAFSTTYLLPVALSAVLPFPFTIFFRLFLIIYFFITFTCWNETNARGMKSFRTSIIHFAIRNALVDLFDMLNVYCGRSER